MSAADDRAGDWTRRSARWRFGRMQQQQVDKIMNFSVINTNYLFTDTPAAQPLLSANQTEFTIEAELTRRGRTCRTRDIMEVTAYIWGLPVESESRERNLAVQCRYSSGYGHTLYLLSRKANDIKIIQVITI